MLSIEELKSWLHHDLPRADKLLLVLGSFKAPCEVAEIRSRAKQAGFRIPTKWNISSILSGTKGKALRTPTGWELAESGQQRLKTIGVRKSIAAAQVATDLRTLLAKVKDHDTRAFVEEAVKCYEFELYRAAVVMSWLAAFHVLKKEVHENHLAAFNAEATRVDPKWRPAKTTDELEQIPVNFTHSQRA